MAVAFVGQAADNGFQEPVTVSYASTGGNLLILCVHHHGSSTSPTVTDSAGNTWLVAGATTSASGNEGRGTMYYCLNASAITSVTIPQQGSAVAANISEWSGVASFRDASTGYDQFPSSFRVPTTATAGDMVISQASVWAQNGAPPTPSAGWTALTSGGTGSNYIAAAYELGSVGGSRGPTFTMPSGVGKFGNVTAAFVPAASATQHPASGTAAATSGASGTVTARRVAASTAAAVTALTGAVTTLLPASGSAAAASGATGAAAALRPATGQASGVSGAQGSVTALLPATGTAEALATATGQATSLLPAAGVAAAVSGASGSASVVNGPQTYPASGTAEAVSGGSGEVTALLAASGTAAAVSGASGSAVITEQQGGTPIDITISGASVPTTGWEANGPTTGWAATSPAGYDITGTAPTTGWSATIPELTDMPLANNTTRADTTEFWKATVTADHDITGMTIELAMPPVSTAATTWYPVTVDSVTETPSGSGKWVAAYRILVGPNGGEFTLAGGNAKYDYTLRVTEGVAPAERPTFKIATITVTDT